MYWKHGTARISAPTVPLHVIGTVTDMQLTLVTGATEVINNAYLFCPQPANAGILQAKRAADSTYMDIKGPFDATCYLGYIGAATEVAIDIRIQFQAGSDEGYRIIPIMVGHDDHARLPDSLWNDAWTDLWYDEWTELWNDEW